MQNYLWPHTLSTRPQPLAFTVAQSVAVYKSLSWKGDSHMGLKARSMKESSRLRKCLMLSSWEKQYSHTKPICFLWTAQVTLACRSFTLFPAYSPINWLLLPWPWKWKTPLISQNFKCTATDWNHSSIPPQQHLSPQWVGHSRCYFTHDII